MEDSTDAALVAAALTGDGAAYAALVERHARAGRRVLDDPSQAEDAVQREKAVLWGLLDLDRLRRPDRFGSWPAGIGLNACRRELRRRVRLAANLRGSPDDLVEGLETTDLIPMRVADVHALPEDEHVVVLTEVDGDRLLRSGSTRPRLWHWRSR